MFSKYVSKFFAKHYLKIFLYAASDLVGSSFSIDSALTTLGGIEGRRSVESWHCTVLFVI